MGVGSGVFKSPGRRLHLRAMNERSRQGPRAGPSAGPRPATLRLQHLAPRANSRGSLPSALQAQPASQLPPPPRAPGTARLPPTARQPTPSPSSSRWMMLSMLSLSISAIAFPPPALPQRRRRRLAPGTHTSFPTPRAQRRWWRRWQQPRRVPPSRPAPCFLLLSPLEPREEQNGRRLLSQSRSAHGCARGSAAARPGLLYGPKGAREGAGPERGEGAGPERGNERRRLSVTAIARGIPPPNRPSK